MDDKFFRLEDLHGYRVMLPVDDLENLDYQYMEQFTEKHDTLEIQIVFRLSKG